MNNTKTIFQHTILGMIFQFAVYVPLNSVRINCRTNKIKARSLENMLTLQYKV